MNPEPSPAESSQVPAEPAGVTDLAGTTARDGAAIGTTVTLPGSAVGVVPAASTADAPVLSPTADVANAPGLAPAADVANAPGLGPAACGARLTELFPALFPAAGAPGPVRPIKLRIHADIQARAPGIFSKRALGVFFSRYTTTNAYLKALTLAPHRFDLDGQAAGEISDEHRRLATEELARRHALATERRAAQRPAPRRDATTRDDGAAPGAQREPPPAHRPDPRPDARPAAPPRQRPRDSAQRTDRRNDAMPPSRPEQTVRPPRRGEPAPRAAHPQRRAPAPPAPELQALAALPVDPAQRERVLLLRSFKASPLSKANFCALKDISEATLDAALGRAESEGAAKAAQKKSGSQ